MPPIPTIPTDNLYKFCAVSGLVLLLFGATFPVQELFETQNDIDQITTKVEIQRLQVAYFKEDSQRANSDLNRLEKDTNAAAASPHAADVPWLKARLVTVSTTLGTVHKQGHELAIANAKLDGDVTHLVRLSHRMWLYIAAAALFMLGGSRLAFFGFARWYLCLQKPTDDLLARQNHVDSG